MGILSLLTAVDSYFISHAFFTTLLRGATAQIIFGFEVNFQVFLQYHNYKYLVRNSIHHRNSCCHKLSLTRT